MITSYRKKPIEVDILQWTGSNETELIEFTNHQFEAIDPEDRAEDPEMTAQVFDVLHSTWVGVYTGQHIVRGVFYPIAEDVLAETYERVEFGPAATEATERETTTRVFAALHRSAEEDVTRVIALYEQWVKAGPPPLGVSLSRWWDARLAELHAAVLPPADQPKETPDA